MEGVARTAKVAMVVAAAELVLMVEVGATVGLVRRT